ncbi:unnamed protein product, partial [Notodromas monacha]
FKVDKKTKFKSDLQTGSTKVPEPVQRRKIDVVFPPIAGGLGRPRRKEKLRKLPEFPVIKQLKKSRVRPGERHNDLAWNIRQFKQNQLRNVNFSSDFLATHSHPWSKSPWSQTDLVRLKAGLVGAQFWSAYAPCGSQDYNAVQIILEQIDVIKRFIDHYPKTLALATSSSRKFRRQ